MTQEEIALEKAEQQLYGYSQAQKGTTLIELIEAMGLTEEEWKQLKIEYPMEEYFLGIDLIIIEKYFNS